MDVASWIGNPYIFWVVVAFELVLLVAAASFGGLLRARAGKLRQATRDLPSEKDEILLPQLVHSDFQHWVDEGTVIEGRTYRPAEVTRFFDIRVVLDRLRVGCVGYEMATHLASTATGIGILGTFFGVARGLGALSSSDPSEITGDIHGVIENLSSAFTTSIVGVIVAILINLWLSSQESRLRAALDRLDTALQQRFPRLTPSVVMHELGVSFAENAALAGKRHAETRELLDDIKQTNSVMANEIVEKLTRGFDDVMQQRLAPALERLTGLVEGQLASAQSAASEQVRAFMGEAIGEFRETAQQMGRGISQAAERFESVIGGVTESMTSVERSVGSQKELLEEQRRLIASSLSANSASSTRIQEASEVAAQLAKLGEQLGALQKDVSGSVAAQAQERGKLVEDTRAIAGSFQAAQAGFRAGAEEVAGLAPALRDTLDAGTAQLAAVNDKLGQTSKDATAALERVATAAAAISQGLGDAMRQLKARVAQEEQLVRGFGEAHRHISASLEQSRPVVADLAKAATGIQQREQLAARTMEGLQKASGEVLTAAGQLGHALTKATQDLDRAVQQLRAQLEAQRGWTDTSTHAVEQFAEKLKSATDRSFANIDASLQAALNSLTSIVSDVHDSVDGFSSALRNGSSNGRG